MSACRKAFPFIARATASGANVIGSLIALFTQDKPNPFFYLSLYAGITYFTSNIYEAYDALYPGVTAQQVHDLEAIRVDTFVDSVTNRNSPSLGR